MKLQNERTRTCKGLEAIDTTAPFRIGRLGALFVLALNGTTSTSRTITRHALAALPTTSHICSHHNSHDKTNLSA